MRRGREPREEEAWLDSDGPRRANNSNNNNATTKKSANSRNTTTNDNNDDHDALAIGDASRRALGHAAVALVPFGAQAAASAAAYRSGLAAAQLLGLLLRVSSCTPVLGPCLGALGVGFASTLAGVAARHARKLCTSGGNPLERSWWEAPAPADAALDCALGVVLHRCLGGRFSAVMPSDLARPGARALDSLPASADGAYAAPGAKRELARMFRRDGCHHCGTRKGPVVGDHMPPNVYVSGPAPGTPNPGGYRGGDLLMEGEKMLARFRAALSAATGTGGGGGGGGGRGRAGAVAGAAGVPARLRQRFYAQCQKCSVRQAVAVRTGRRTLVLHLAPLGSSRPERAAGLLVGLRQGAPPLASDSPVAIVASRVGGAVSGAAASAVTAVRELRERRRREEAEKDKGTGGKGRGGGSGPAAAAAGGGGGGGWGGGGRAAAAAAARGNNNNNHQNNSSGFASVNADDRLMFQPYVSQRQEQVVVAWAAGGGGGGSGARQQQQQQPQPPQQQRPQHAAALAAADPVQGGLLAGLHYAEFVANAAAASPAPAWGSAAGDVQQQQQQQQQRAAAAAQAGAGSAPAAAAAAAAGPPARCYDAALAAYVSPGGSRARSAVPYTGAPAPLPAHYLSGQGGAAAAQAAAAAPLTASAPPAPSLAPGPGALGDLSGSVVVMSAADAKRRAQAAFDRHFAAAV